MSENKTFSVQVSTTSAKKIGVSSNVSENPITATSDTGLYYSQLAKNWAIGEGLIENTDYSSKAYAQESKAYALDSKAYSETARLDLESLDNKIIEYEEQLNDTVATGLSELSVLQADSLAEITTNKESALSDIDINKTNTLAQISTLANTSISDINAVGKSYDNLTYRNITNCLLEVPQRIKYDLTDGTLTVKAGTVVIVPYGTEDKTSELPVGATFINDNFKVYDTQYTEDADGNGKFFVWAELVNNIIEVSGTSTDNYLRPVVLDLSVSELVIYKGIISGTNDYTGTGNQIVYRTDENIVKKYTSGALKSGVVSLPLLTVLSNGSIYVGSVDQVFNGFGYIGSTIWIDKDVKGLIPNGRNEDGSLKNIEWVNDNIIVTTHSLTNRVNQPVFVDITHRNAYPLGNHYTVDSYTGKDYNLMYDSILNNYYYNSTSDKYSRSNGFIVAFGDIDANSNFTSFNPKQPFRAVDYSEYSNKVEEIETNIDGKWVKYSSTLANGVTINAGATLTYNINNILPNDNYIYEVLISCYGKTGNSSGNTVDLRIGTDILAAANNLVCSAVTRTSSMVHCSGSCTIPVSSSRNIYVTSGSSSAAIIGLLRIGGYRRIRTN